MKAGTFFPYNDLFGEDNVYKKGMADLYKDS